MLNKQNLDSIGTKHGEKKALGSTLAKRVAETKADENALATSIAAVVGEITAALSSIAGVSDIPMIEAVSTRDADRLGFTIAVKESEAKRKAGVA